ncbi:MAG TPA: HPr-rel-A system PqqD family peptide chaperone [Spirochaetota bacterium]|nr:HPr-rel-A system PqqD family peptide chaperone [Spirochaetota bacterium]
MSEPTNRLRNLAISDTGFVFDPSTGNTFLLNETGIFILRKLVQGCERDAVVEALVEEYDVDAEQAGRDLADILIQMQEFGMAS